MYMYTLPVLLVLVVISVLVYSLLVSDDGCTSVGVLEPLIIVQ